MLQALKAFAGDVAAKVEGHATGEPEAQLHSPLSGFLEQAGNAIGSELTVKAESRVDRIGIPDFAVLRDRLLIGHLETKAPGTGADTARFRGHNRAQWERFKDLPNLLYTDGNAWGLYQNGERTGALVRLTGDIATEGPEAVTREDAQRLKKLLEHFLSWEVIAPRTAKQLAELLAPLCRLLRDEVADSLKEPRSSLVRLADEWREHLFPDASDEYFADAYAQTVTYALLLARAEGADTLDLGDASESLEAEHTMLSRALQVMTLPKAEREIRPALRLVQRMIASVEPETLDPDGETDPWLYFYEEFLAEYNPKLRKDAGAYYTPVEVVRAQVRLIDHLLTERFGKRMGFAEGNGVVVLDPAVGTGTYLLGIVDHAMNRVAEEEGEGAIRGRAALLWQNLHGFEYMVSPYAVAELRLTQSMMRYQGDTPGSEPPVYLTNTLESPFTEPPAPSMFYDPIAKEHERALRVKDREPVMVCLGNPPYDRHEAGTSENRARTGGWVRWGEDGEGARAPLEDYLEPARSAGMGQHLKNIYNLYVYFWRWAFWKVFEHKTSTGPGIVSYISASSYLEGDAFVGMREHIRRAADEVWIIDLGGEGRGTRKDENVFAIQTPVAIAIAVRNSRTRNDEVPAKVHYTRITGDRDEKLAALDSISTFEDLTWDDCPSEWQAPFTPTRTGTYFDWPSVVDLMPWQISGVQVKRSWPIGPEAEILHRRWERLLATDAQEDAFSETRDRKVTSNPRRLFRADHRLTPISESPPSETPEAIRPYAYRSFDVEHIIADNRVGDYMRPALWYTYGEQQIYFTSLFNHPLGSGPAMTVAGEVPDLHHFRGSYGAREVIPLYRDREAKEGNVAPGLLALLSDLYDTQVTPKEWAGYLFGVLGQPGYVERFFSELVHREVRVPVTKDAALFARMAKLGQRLIWLHTFGERMVPEGHKTGDIPRGAARCVSGVSSDPDGYPKSFSYDPDSQTLTVGDGTFAPVKPEVWDFQVSGLVVVATWLDRRMKEPSGRKSSDLDKIRPERWPAVFTSELLRLLWILEQTIEQYPRQEELLGDILDGPLVNEEELPEVPDEARRAPPEPREEQQSLDM